jgi:stalled ribosome rescue protein Dom34
MTTFHAVVWLDSAEAHVLMFDREHVEAQRIKSRSHHKHQGKDSADPNYFPGIAAALAGTHEVLLAGPGATRTEFLTWCTSHRGGAAILPAWSMAPNAARRFYAGAVRSPSSRCAWCRRTS